MPKPIKRAGRTSYRAAQDRPDYYRQRKVIMDALHQHDVIRFDNKPALLKYRETLAQLEREGLIITELVETGEQSTELKVRLAHKR